MSVGENIKRLRKERKMTQEQLGDLLGVKKAAVQKYENGTVKNLKQETIKKLSEVFNVPATNFIDAEPISKQVELIFEIKETFGEDAVDLLEMFTQLNSNGREKVIEYTYDMNKVYK